MLERPTDPFAWAPCVAAIVAALSAYASFRGITAKTATTDDVDAARVAAHQAEAAARKGEDTTRAEGAVTREAMREESRPQNEKLDQILAMLREQREGKARTEGRTISPQEEADFEEQVRAIFASKDARKAPAQEALAEGRTMDAADRLMTVASQEGAAADDFSRSAAETYREAGALYLASAPARALAAYREATRLDASDFWSWIFLARLESSHGVGLTASRAASEAALNVARSEREKSVANHEIGDVAVAEGDLASAKAAYAEGLDIRRALSDADKSSAAARRDVSVSLNKIGDVAVAAGDLASAKAAYAEGLDIARALLDADPTSAAARRDVIVSLDKLGDTTGDKVYFREALGIALAMQAAGQLSPADAFIPDYLRRKLV